MTVRVNLSSYTIIMAVESLLDCSGYRCRKGVKVKHIKVLDCTLRDGGYCNDWVFGKENIQKIVRSLVEANIDIIECGYITQRQKKNADRTQFVSLSQMSRMLPDNAGKRIFVGMVNFGEYKLEDIPNYSGSGISGIRVCFHKKKRYEALEFCKGLKEKGYMVFIQGMVSLSYTDEEFVDMIHRVNEIEPYAFYIVDSFGMMKGKDLIRLFYTVEHNLRDNVLIGFHSHNNMQLAYSNCLSLCQIQTNRSVVIDSSVYGMGRGAGNLNTELFVEYLNENKDGNYQLKPLLTIIDDVLNVFYQRNYWGYSLPNYLSAKHNAHPNYAWYLDSKKTLTVEAMEDIFNLMDEDKKTGYDKDYIEQLYVQYMETGKVQSEHLHELKAKVEGNTVLIIAPGMSSKEEKDKIISYALNSRVITISINFDYPELATDYIFLSNLRRYRELEVSKRGKCIVTSNVPSVDVYLQTKYSDLLNEVDTVEDNAGLMLIKYLIDLGAKKIVIAGIDGYSIDPAENFADKKMNFYTQKATFEAMNAGLNSVLKRYKEDIELEFITTPKFVIL